MSSSTNDGDEKKTMSKAPATTVEAVVAASTVDISAQKRITPTMSHAEMDSIGQIVGDTVVVPVEKDTSIHVRQQRQPKSSMTTKTSHFKEEEGEDTMLLLQSPPPPSNDAVREPMEIDAMPSEDDDDAVADDLEALLGADRNNHNNNTTTTTSTTTKTTTITGMTIPRSKSKASSSSCCACHRVGNIIVLNRSCLDKTGGYGIIGPHWFGPPVVIFILTWASHHFIHRAKQDVGPMSMNVCFVFLVACMYFLFDTCYKDPGIVPLMASSRRGNNNNSDNDDDRWCDFCNAAQPSDGAHCPDCNVCIAGYDHHCVWMGVCIGKKNVKSFMRFNMCWLLYLLYSIFWVSAMGPVVTNHWGKKL